MVDDGHVLHRTPNGARIAQIAVEDLDALLLQECKIAPRPHEHAHAFASGAQLLDDVAAKLPGGAGNEVEFGG
jgi:hypothetical protein